MHAHMIAELVPVPGGAGGATVHEGLFSAPDGTIVDTRVFGCALATPLDTHTPPRMLRMRLPRVCMWAFSAVLDTCHSCSPLVVRACPSSCVRAPRRSACSRRACSTMVPRVRVILSRLQSAAAAEWLRTEREFQARAWRSRRRPCVWRSRRRPCVFARALAV